MRPPNGSYEVEDMSTPASGIESSLISGETVEYQTSKHWMAPVADSKWAILLLLGALLLAWLAPENNGAITGFLADAMGFIKVVLLIGGIGSIAYNIVAWRTSSYYVTNRRVLGRDGLVRRRSTDTMLASINDVRSETSALGRALGYGDVKIMSSSGKVGADAFTSLQGVDEFKQHVMEAKDRLEAPPAPVAAVAPAAASVASPPPAADVTATLESLAKLRDSGAITAEEYEAKKTELLNRI